MFAIADLTFPANAWNILLTVWPAFLAVGVLQCYVLRGRVSGRPTISFAVSFGVVLSWFLTWLTSITGIGWTWSSAVDNLALELGPFWYWQVSALAVSLVGFGIPTAIALLVDRQRVPIQPVHSDITSLETILVVTPAFAIWGLCLLWVLFVVAFPSWDRARTPPGSMFFWFAGTFVGIVALRVSASPQYLARVRRGPMWCAIGLIVGITASLSVLRARQAGTLDVDMPIWLPYMLLLPVAVGIRRLSKVL